MPSFCKEKLEECYVLAEQRYEDEYYHVTFDYCEFLSDVIEYIHKCALEYDCEGEARAFCQNNVIPHTQDECPNDDFSCEFTILSDGDIAAITLACLLFILLVGMGGYYFYVKRKNAAPTSPPRANQGKSDVITEELTV